MIFYWLKYLIIFLTCLFIYATSVESDCEGAMHFGVLFPLWYTQHVALRMDTVWWIDTSRLEVHLSKTHCHCKADLTVDTISPDIKSNMRHMGITHMTQSIPSLVVLQLQKHKISALLSTEGDPPPTGGDVFDILFVIVAWHDNHSGGVQLVQGHKKRAMISIF